ncbi:MAG TPA: DUF6443 domain-containing protein, partial [Niastella sp.]
MIIPYINNKYIKNRCLGFHLMLVVTCVVLCPRLLFAQCPLTNKAFIGDIQGYHLSSSEADGASNIFWTIGGSIGTIQGDRTKRDVTIRWDLSGTANVVVTYNKLSVQYTKCWTVSVFPPLSPGTISASVTTVLQNDVFSYSQLLNATLASGGLNALETDKFKYQWEESNDNITWTTIIGATNISCTGSNVITGKTYFRRRIHDGYTTAFSNVLAIDVTAPFKGGRISASQKITSGVTPAQLTSTSSPSGGTGTFVYQWESSVDEISWSSISGAAAASYQPGALSKTTYYRRKVSSGSQWTYSNALQILVVSTTAINKPVSGTPAATVSKEAIPAYTALDPDALAAVTSYRVYKPGVSDATQVPWLDPSKDFIKSTVYLDGLSRPIQNINYKAGVSGKDIVVVDVYDQFGRETVNHLPYAAPTDATNAGKFRTDAASQQPQFFNALTGSQEDYYYTVSIPEQS